MKTWAQLSREEKGQVAYDWLQSEGYDSDGNEHDSPKDYYSAIHRPVMRCSKNEAMILAAERGEITGAS